MNVRSQLRENLYQHLVTLFADSDDVGVEKIAEPKDVWAIAATKKVGICRTGVLYDPAEMGRGNVNVQQGCRAHFIVVVAADSPETSTSALEETDGVEDLVTTVLQARGLDIGTADTGAVWLDATEEKPQSRGKDSPPGEAGPIATAIAFETTDFFM